ncbi:MAG: hypothetical protein V2J55_04160 [Candidatus Competibacteraceae bacterium]|jgi:hypothetical protein|nr:hypothetical protein [Candidatus Competibacteraceae bacterium]
MVELQRQHPDSVVDLSLHDPALVRIKAYWRGLGVVDETKVTLLSQRAMQRALNCLHTSVTQEELTLRALQEVQNMMDEWLTVASPEKPLLARVALLDGAVPDWPMQLATHSHRPETISILSQTLPEPVPPYGELAMPEQRIVSGSFLYLMTVLKQLLLSCLDALKRRLTRTGQAK